MRWYLFGSTNFEMHAPHWHGNVVTANHMRTDVVGLLPMGMLVADMTPDAAGPFGNSDLELEQELSRPYVYIDRANEAAKKPGVIGFDIISIKDPSKPRLPVRQSWGCVRATSAGLAGR